MKVTLTREYWILADRDKEYFVATDEKGEYVDWTQQISEAWKFPSEETAIIFNQTRSYVQVLKDEVSPIRVKSTFEF